MEYFYKVTWSYQSTVGRIDEDNYERVKYRPYIGVVEPMVRYFKSLEDAMEFYSSFDFTFTVDYGLVVGERSDTAEEPFFPVSVDNELLDEETTTITTTLVVKRECFTEITY
jgi:hypothetical protein